MRLRALLLVPTFVLASFAVLSTAHAATLEVEQQNEEGVVGTWTLIKPDNDHYKGVGLLQKISNPPAGGYLLIVDPPEGATASVRVYVDGEQVAYKQSPQVTFTVGAEDNVRVSIHLTFTRVGGVSVGSDPPGIPFKMVGPNGTSFEGVTPKDYKGVAEGLYSVQYEGIEGCYAPAPKSLQLQQESRISFTITFDCDGADKLREEQDIHKDPNIVTVNGDLSFGDVPQTAWFAPHVFEMAKLGILTGYKDDAGNSTGEFGPGNSVTVGELAKIAHRIVGIDEKGVMAPPHNPLATGTGAWFAPFIASAEQHGWTIFVDATIDPRRPATRGEVLVTLLQVLDVPVTWAKGQMFTDVTLMTPYASAIETAALDEIVEGHKNASGELSGTFGPVDPINRAEMAKMVKAAIDTYRLTDEEE